MGGTIGKGLDKVTGGGKKAAKANKANLAEIKALFEGLNSFVGSEYGKAFEGIDKIGETGKQNALSQGRIGMAGAQQNLAGSGLWGSTVTNAVNRGIQQDTMRSLANIDSQIAGMKSNLHTGLAGLQSQNIGQLGSILGGVQHKAGTDYLGQLLKGAGGMMGGGLF